MSDNESRYEKSASERTNYDRNLDDIPIKKPNQQRKNYWNQAEQFYEENNNDARKSNFGNWKHKSQTAEFEKRKGYYDNQWRGKPQKGKPKSQLAPYVRKSPAAKAKDLRRKLKSKPRTPSRKNPKPSNRGKKKGLIARSSKKLDTPVNLAWC